jgi:hypothetical protein
MLRRERMKNPPRQRDFEVLFKDGTRDIVSADDKEQVARVYRKDKRTVKSITMVMR